MIQDLASINLKTEMQKMIAMILMLHLFNTKNQQYCSLELKLNAVWMPYED